MASPRQTQYRPARDTRKTRELADLRRQRHQLERERGRLQEALERSPRPRVIKTTPEADAEPPRPKARGGKSPCPNCGEPLQLIDLGRFEMWACPNCKWHVKKE